MLNATTSRDCYTELGSGIPQIKGPNSQQGLVQYNTDQRCVTQIDVHQHGALVQTPVGGYTNIPGNSTAPPATFNRGRDLKIVMFISLVYFLMIVPGAVVNLKSENDLIWPDESDFACTVSYDCPVL
ncbi:hypothetical protein Btru_056788 [Bulinus truncatus]|nr:hypothetical protein Btru_056788 [Bulinus truncatus]